MMFGAIQDEDVDEGEDNGAEIERGREKRRKAKRMTRNRMEVLIGPKDK